MVALLLAVLANGHLRVVLARRTGVRVCDVDGSSLCWTVCAGSDCCFQVVCESSFAFVHCSSGNGSLGVWYINICQVRLLKCWQCVYVREQLGSDRIGIYGPCCGFVFAMWAMR